MKRILMLFVLVLALILITSATDRGTVINLNREMIKAQYAQYTDEASVLPGAILAQFAVQLYEGDARTLAITEDSQAWINAVRQREGVRKAQGKIYYASAKPHSRQFGMLTLSEIGRAAPENVLCSFSNVNC